MRVPRNGPSLCEAFLFSLANYVKDELISYDLPTSLEELTELATRIDLRIQVRQREPGVAKAQVRLLSAYKARQSLSQTSKMLRSQKPGRLVTHSYRQGKDIGTRPPPLPVLWLNRTLSRQMSIKDVTHKTTPVRMGISGTHD